jgi:chemotaxis protein MotB
MKPEESRVRIVKKRGHGDGHHGGAWKVAYADFVTTMMALFIVLWIISTNTAVKEGIAQYFKNPGAFKEGRVASLAAGGAGVLPAEAPPPAKEEDTEGDAKEERALREAAGQIKDLTKKGGGFEDLRNQIRIEITPEGLRIELMERDGLSFFELGSAVLVHPLKPLLEKLQVILGELPNPIAIEGHTDSRRYHHQKGYSNWELSVDRANSARRVLEAAGLPADRTERVVGHADRVPLVASDLTHASNRRITILVRRQHLAGRARAGASSGTESASPSTQPR